MVQRVRGHERSGKPVRPYTRRGSQASPEWNIRALQLIDQPSDLERLADVKYEERRGGFSCGSCVFFSGGDCIHPLVRTTVSAEGCCTLWSGPSEFSAERTLKEME